MRGWLARWRVAARIARREARRAKGRTALVTVLVALPVVAATTMLVAMGSATATDATFARLTIGTVAQARVQYQCPAPIAQDARGGIGSSCGYDETAVSRPTVGDLETGLREVLGDVPLQRYVTTFARAVGPGQGLEVDYGEVAVTELTRPVLTLTAGRLPEAPGEVVAKPWVTAELDVGTGEAVTITLDDGPTSVVVVGVLSANAQVASVVGPPGTLPGLDPADEDVAEELLLAWFVGGPQPVSWTQVLDLNESGLTAASRIVLADLPPRGAMPYYRDGWSTGDTPSLSSSTVYAGLVGVGLTEMVLLVGPAFAVGAQRSRRALALQGAVGADRRQLRRTVLSSALVIGLGASLVGAAAGVAFGALIVLSLDAFVNLVVPWTQIAGVVAIGLLVALAAAALPARAAGRLDVLAVLNGRAGSAAPSRRALVAGLLVLALGTAAALFGAVRALPTVALAGVVAILLGAVTSAPGLLATVAGSRLRLPLAGRYALRDALRHRSRTGPALAAVIAAVAGGIAGATLLAGTLAHTRDTLVPTTADGVVQIAVDRTWLTEDERTHVPGHAAAAAADAAPLGDLAAIAVLVAAGEPDAVIELVASTPPENVCPAWTLDRAPTAAESRESAGDPRCAVTGTTWSRALTPTFGDVIVDDGSMVRTTRLPGSAAAADALAEGAALVGDPRLLWADGTVHLTVVVDGAEVSRLTLPGQVFHASFSDSTPVLPAAALQDLAGVGLTSLEVGALADPPKALTEDEAAAARAAVATVVGAAPFVVEHAAVELPPPDATVATGVGIALALALAATWIAVGLAAADQKADQATLAAVGADPAWRRRLAGAHAGVLAGAGSLLGGVVGLLLGAALTLGRRGVWPDLEPAWSVQVPWDVLGVVLVGVPSVAALVVMALTRSRLAMVRRRAD